jgi:hypothetical protein
MISHPRGRMSRLKARFSGAIYPGETIIHNIGERALESNSNVQWMRLRKSTADADLVA